MSIHQLVQDINAAHQERNDAHATYTQKQLALNDLCRQLNHYSEARGLCIRCIRDGKESPVVDARYEHCQACVDAMPDTGTDDEW